MDPRREDGIALVLALAVLAFLSATTATALYVVTSSHSTANDSSAKQNAYALAQAGLNDSLAVLTGQLNADGSVRTGADNPATDQSLLTSRTVSYPSLGGTVTYSGTLNTSTYVWTITSTGTVSQQDTSTPVTRTLTQQDTVSGIDQGASGGSWSRFYQDDASRVPDARRRDLRDQRRHEGLPRAEGRRGDHRLDRQRRRRHERDHHRGGDERRPEGAERRVRVDEPVLRLHRG